MIRGTEPLAALDLLAASNLVNYFCRQDKDQVDKNSIIPTPAHSFVWSKLWRNEANDVGRDRSEDGGSVFHTLQPTVAFLFFRVWAYPNAFYFNGGRRIAFYAFHFNGGRRIARWWSTRLSSVGSDPTSQRSGDNRCGFSGFPQGSICG